MWRSHFHLFQIKPLTLLSWHRMLILRLHLIKIHIHKWHTLWIGKNTVRDLPPPTVTSPSSVLLSPYTYDKSKSSYYISICKVALQIPLDIWGWQLLQSVCNIWQLIGQLLRWSQRSRRRRRRKRWKVTSTDTRQEIYNAQISSSPQYQQPSSSLSSSSSAKVEDWMNHIE